jgi:four helix bundle protein
MKTENVIRNKSFEFALKIIDLFKYLQDEKKEFVLSKQILRSGTSVGANVEEAQAAQSKKDFFAKMSIATKEARETHYWLRLLKHGKFIIKNDLFEDCEEIIRLLTSIVKSSAKN